MASALSPPGPGRFAAADAVLSCRPGGHARPRRGRGGRAGRARAPAAGAVARAAAVPGVARAVGDITFPVGAWDARGRALGSEPIQGHGWASAALTPYRLRDGHRPAGPHDVVADARLGVRVGQRMRVVTPAGESTYRVSGLAHGPAGDRRAAVLHRRGGRAAVGHAGRGRRRRRDRAARRLRRAAAGEAAGRGGRRRAGGRPRGRGRPRRSRCHGSRGPDRHLRLDGRDRRRRRAVRGRGHVRARDRPAPAGDRRAARARGLAGAGPAAAGRRGADRVARRIRARRARRPPAGECIVDVLAGHGVVPAGFEPSTAGSRSPRRSAAGSPSPRSRWSPPPAGPAACARRGAARSGDRARAPGMVQTLAGVISLGGGIAMAIIFSGEAALAFSIIGGLLLATGTALLGGSCSACPPRRCRCRCGGSGRPACSPARGSPPTAGGPRRSPARSSSSRCSSARRRRAGQLAAEGRGRTAARITAGHVLAGRDGAPLPAGTAQRVAGLQGVARRRRCCGTDVFLLDHGLGWDTPWPAAGLDSTAAHRSTCT